MSETQKISYSKKLRDPRWQKKRLEVLEAKEWVCCKCFDSTSTLHVHHNQYFKGKEPWEYELDQFSVLCEHCHVDHHDSTDRLLLAASFIPNGGAPWCREAVAEVLLGVVGKPASSDEQHDRKLNQIGVLLHSMMCWSYEPVDLLELAPLIEDFLVNKNKEWRVKNGITPAPKGDAS